MIVFVGKELKLGALIDVAKTRLGEEVVIVEPEIDIKKQENDILLKSEGARAIIYDTEQYYNDADEIIAIIKRIQRTNSAKPILLVPTSNPKNEILKNAVDAQIKNFVNTALSLGEQKDQFEKNMTDFFDVNKREDIEEVKEVIEEEDKNLKSYVTELYDASQREEERENTVIINQKGTTEVVVSTLSKIFRTIIGIIIILLCAIGVTTLIYDNIRGEFIKVVLAVYNEITKMI